MINNNKFHNHDVMLHIAILETGLTKLITRMSYNPCLCADLPVKL